MHEKMTDEELDAYRTRHQRREMSGHEDKLWAHIAALTAERDDWERKFRNADMETTRVVSERDALRERVTALEGQVRALAVEKGTLLAQKAQTTSRLAAIRQRAHAIEHVIGKENMAFLLEDDAPAPSEMDGLRGEMAERKSVCQCGDERCPLCCPPSKPPAPTTVEAFAAVREEADALTSALGGMSETFRKVTGLLSLLERRMGAQEAALRAVLEKDARSPTHTPSPVIEKCRAALTDAQPVFTLEEAKALEERLKNEVPNPGEQYLSGWLDALNTFTQELERLRR